RVRGPGELSGPPGSLLRVLPARPDARGVTPSRLPGAGDPVGAVPAHRVRARVEAGWRGARADGRRVSPARGGRPRDGMGPPGWRYGARSTGTVTSRRASGNADAYCGRRN